MEGEVIGESSDSNGSANNTLLTNLNRARNGTLVSSGLKFKGVVPQQNGHWGAQIYTKHQRIWLGTFKSEMEAAMAYDSAAIKVRSGDSYRNFPWTPVTLQEPDFQAQYSTEAVLNMIKDGSYQSRFADFLRNHSQSSAEEGVGGSFVELGHGDGKLSCKQLFQKELTPSDVGKLNRLVIPKKYAVKYFPPIPPSGEENGDGSSPEDVELVFYDRCMRLWKFRYCYWGSSQSFVFTRGWNRFVKEKELKENETVTFFLCERRGELQKQMFFMIDVDREQVHGVPAAEGASQKVGMLVELQLALGSSIHDCNEAGKELEEGDGVVQVEPLELQLALRPSGVHDEGSDNLKEEEDAAEVTDNNVNMVNLELQLELGPSVWCNETKAEAGKKLGKEEAREDEAEGFKLFGVRLKRQCLREWF